MINYINYTLWPPAQLQMIFRAICGTFLIAFIAQLFVHSKGNIAKIDSFMLTLVGDEEELSRCFAACSLWRRNPNKAGPSYCGEDNNNYTSECHVKCNQTTVVCQHECPCTDKERKKHKRRLRKRQRL